MRTLALLSLFTLFACHASPPTSTYPETGVAALGWLTGAWSGSTDEGVTVEASYSTPAGDMIVAATKEIGADGKLAMFDFEFITERAGKLMMRPFPFGKPSVVFQLTELDAQHRRAVFENPDHDFPRRFEYHSPTHDDLHVILDGEMNGSAVHAKYTLRRSR